MSTKYFASLIDQVRQERPLVHNITNVVVTGFTANGLLALGASPVMAYAHEEVADMAKNAGALATNIGTLNETVIEAIILAGQSANTHGVPVILDPVGAGATPYRSQAVKRILNHVKIDVLRGNAAEVANVIGEQAEIRGVDATSDQYNVAELAKRAACQLQTIVAVTGPVDYVSDGEVTYEISSSTKLMTLVTGAGCLLSSTVAAFAAVEKNTLIASTAAMAFYGAAALRAVEVSGENRPGTFQVAFLDALHDTCSDHVQALSVVRAL